MKDNEKFFPTEWSIARRTRWILEANAAIKRAKALLRPKKTDKPN